MTRPPLISESADLLTIARLRRAIQRLLQETGQQAFCRHRPDGSAGCGAEIWFCLIRGGGTRELELDDQGETHRCGERKP